MPATSATSLWVFFSLFSSAATYNAAAAMPAGPLPEVNSEISAFFSIFSASFCVFGDKCKTQANLAM